MSFHLLWLTLEFQKSPISLLTFVRLEHPDGPVYNYGCFIILPVLLRIFYLAYKCVTQLVYLPFSFFKKRVGIKEQVGWVGKKPGVQRQSESQSTDVVSGKRCCDLCRCQRYLWDCLIAAFLKHKNWSRFESVMSELCASLQQKHFRSWFELAEFISILISLVIRNSTWSGWPGLSRRPDKKQFYCRNMWFSDEEGPPKHVRAWARVCSAVWGNDKSSGFRGD